MQQASKLPVAALHALLDIQHPISEIGAIQVRPATEQPDQQGLRCVSEDSALRWIQNPMMDEELESNKCFWMIY